MSGMLASAVGWAKENPIHAAGVIAACAGIGAVSLNSRPSSDPDTAAGEFGELICFVTCCIICTSAAFNRVLSR